MKKLLTIFVLLTLIVSFTCAVYADDASGFYSIDTDTHGNWVGVYGSDGYLIPNASSETSTWQLPKYASLSFTTTSGSDPSWNLWYDSTSGTEVPAEQLAVTGNAPYTDNTASARRAACVYDGGGLDAVITLTQEAYVTVYTADYDKPYNTVDPRENTATLYDKDMKKIAEYELKDYSNGLYLTFKAPVGTTTLEIVNNVTTGPSNSVILGVFFDTKLGGAKQNTAAETTSAIITKDTTVADKSASEAVNNAPQTGDATGIMISLIVCSIGMYIVTKKAKSL